MISKIEEIDKKFTRYIDIKMASKSLDNFMKFITFIGDYAIAWTIVIGYLFAKNKNVEAFSIIFSVGATSFINELILKKVFKRSRPVHNEKYKNIVIKVPSSYSFPSGHTATAFAVVPIAMGVGGVIGSISLTIATIIGFSRIYLKVHYLSDVMVGATVGVIMSLITQAIFVI